MDNVAFAGQIEAAKLAIAVRTYADNSGTVSIAPDPFFVYIRAYTSDDMLSYSMRNTPKQNFL